MTVADQPKLMTEDEFFALPDDGVERWLINGELREDETGMTVRNAKHSAISARLIQRLLNWSDQRPKPHGLVGGGEIGFRLPLPKPTTVGADVAYVDPETAKLRTDRDLIKGVPLLAVEVLSPSDRNARIEEKVDAYLEAGAKLVWVISPGKKTVTVYRSDREPELFNQTQTIDAEPQLPGFKMLLADLFAD